MKKTGQIAIEIAKNPTSLIMGVAGVALTATGGAGGTSIQAIRNWFISPRTILIFGVICLAGAVLMVIMMVPNVRKAEFNGLRDSIYDLVASFFNKGEIKENLQEKTDSLKGNMIEEIRDVLSDDARTYRDDARVLKKLQDNVENSIDELSSLIDEKMASM